MTLRDDVDDDYGKQTAEICNLHELTFHGYADNDIVEQKVELSEEKPGADLASSKDTLVKTKYN